MEDKKERGYALAIDKDITVRGIKKAVECTDTVVRLELKGGTMTIYGKDLDVKKLDMESGDALIAGDPVEITWGGVKTRGLWKKIFK